MAVLKIETWTESGKGHRMLCVRNKCTNIQTRMKRRMVGVWQGETGLRGVGMIYRRLFLSTSLPPSPAFHLCGNQCQVEAVKDKRMHWRLRVNLMPCPDFSAPFPTA